MPKENLLTKELFIKVLFEHYSAREAYNFFNQYKEYIGKIYLSDCVETLYWHELYFDDSWKQLDTFVPPTNHIHKLILRDLLDLQYVVTCEDDITAERVNKICFLLVEKGMLCIASEFFATACSFLPGMQEEWDKMKNDTNPNLRAYIEKFADKDVNLDFMKGLLKA